MADPPDHDPRPDEPEHPERPEEAGVEWPRWAPQPPPRPAPAIPAPAGRIADPGGPATARLAGVFTILLLIAVAVLQQMATSPAVRAAGRPEPVPPTPAPVARPALDEFGISARVYVRIYNAIRQPELARQGTSELRKVAARPPVEPENQVRLAIALGELEGAEAAQKELDRVEANLPEDSPLRADVEHLRALYLGVEITPREADRLVDHHGWFGRLALVHGAPPGDPARREVVGGGVALVWAIVGGAAAALGLLTMGLVLLITGLVLSSGGQLRRGFVPPRPGGSVALETVAVFIAGFIGLKLMAAGVDLVFGVEAALVAALALQWALVVFVLWPLTRGVSPGRMLELFGLHRGRGVLREMGAGVAGYVACLPLLAAGVVVTLVALAVQGVVRQMAGAPPAPPPRNQVVEIVTGAPPWLLVVFAAMAILWAPLVEETIFRGALYRHLRSRLHWLAAALLVAIAFGAMHGYPLLLLGPVIGLGFGFALLREWRGSLIAPMTAHFIHNSVVLTVVLLAMRMIGD